MANAVARSSLDCSSSGRGSAASCLAFGRTRPRALPLHQAFAPVAHWVSAPQQSGPNRFLQPPLGQRTGRRQHGPLRVAQEVQGTKRRRISLRRKLSELNKAFGIAGAVEFGTGQGNLPTVLLTHPQTGMQLVVYLYGATIAQWMKSDGTATFYDGPDELYQPGMPLSTGVSIHFPQHREGLLPENGFADSMMWDVVGAGFDCPEIIERLQLYFDDLDVRGLVTEEMLDVVDEDKKTAAAVAAAMRAHPPDLTVDSDLAPYVLLCLRDTAATREMWPHRFRLMYKITLGVIDQFTDEDLQELMAEEGLPVDPEAVDDEAEDLDEMEEEVDAEIRATMAAMGMPVEGEGATLRGAGAAAAAAAGAAGAGEEAEEGEEEEGEEDEAGGKRTRRAAAAASEVGGVVTLGAEDAAAEGQPAEAAEAAEEDEDEDEDEVEVDDEDDPDMKEGAVKPERFKPPVQIKQQFWVWNRDKRGSPSMEFNLASLARFRTLQQPQYSDWVKVLGLGGSQMFNYTEDPRYPELDLNTQDYLHFTAEKVDVTYVGAADNTVYLCPGNRTHFEFIQRQGFRDMFVQQPPIQEDPSRGRQAAIGTGYIASTVSLAPGDVWSAESVIRFHERYWRPPIFGDDSMPPLPSLSPEEFDNEGDKEELGEGEAGATFDDLPTDSSAVSSD